MKEFVNKFFFFLLNMVFGQQVGEKKLRQRLCLLGLFIKIVKISLQSITGVYPFLEQVG
jgi:hypothetical protein